MNKSSIPTSEKIMLPLRLTPEVYMAMMMRVRDVKDNKSRGYSVNQFITELLEKELDIKKK